MNIIQRISKLVSANINHLLDAAEDPEVMVRQLIRDMEESIIELRRETVKAIASHKQLEKQIEMRKGQVNELEAKAGLALEQSDEEFARKLLAKKLEMDETTTHLQDELERAQHLAAQMKDDLVKLEDQVQIARRKKEELIRRKVSAQAQLRTHQTLKKSQDALSALTGSVSNADEHINAIESYKEKIMMMEAEAEATEELMDMTAEKELDLEKYAKNKAIEAELARLKKKTLKSGDKKDK